LRLLRGPGDLENYVVEVPPVDGTLLVFPNGPTSWHGHKAFTGQRFSVQLNYMTTDAKARSELRPTGAVRAYSSNPATPSARSTP